MALVVLLAWIGLTVLFNFSLGPTTNPALYASSLARLKPTTGRVSHFPDSIPPDAQDVRFYFDDGGFHGDFAIEVRYTLPPEQIEQLYQSYAAQGSFVRANSSGHLGTDENVLLPPATSATEGLSFLNDPDFVFMIFDTDSGLAIDRKNHVVVYWAYST